MERIVIRHLNGSKANQTEVFPLQELTEILLGRDPTANIKYDPDRDDLVGRMHARIVQDPSDKTKFTLTDLDSRNGTFVNKTRISGTVRIEPGDVVQFGHGGPEFQFDIEPRPENVPRATRIVSVAEEKVPPPTREQHPDVAGPLTVGTGIAAGRSAIGRATVERLIADTKSNSRRILINAGAALLGLIVLVAGGFVYQSMSNKKATEEEIKTAVTEVKTTQEAAIREMKEQAPMTATAIAEQFAPAVVLVEASWKLIDISTGEQLYHLYGPKCVGRDKKTGQCTDIARRSDKTPDIRPYYLISDSGSVEPLLMPQSQKVEVRNRIVNLKNDIKLQDLSKPVGSGGTGYTGSGFVALDNGYILTNRHVGAPWETRGIDSLGDAALPGYLVSCEGQTCEQRELDPNDTDPKARRWINSLFEWVPTKTKTLGGKPYTGKRIEGKHDYLDITFPKTRLRVPARLVRASDVADVALLKVDVPQSVKPVTLDDSDRVNVGDAITIIGYPAVSPAVRVRIKSVDVFNRESDSRTVPDPTVTGGLIGKVIHGEATPVGGSAADYFSEYGDVYQLTVNTTGAGNSGGPVFDDRGRVVGIFTSSRKLGSTEITFAVPIKHGRDIMGIHRVLK